LKGDHPRTIPAKFVLIWFSGFRGEDLNVIFYQNMPVKMSSNFNCSYMAKSSLTNIPGFAVRFFFQLIYTDYAN
jgi:hypothetical protein